MALLRSPDTEAFTSLHSAVENLLTRPSGSPEPGAVTAWPVVATGPRNSVPSAIEPSIGKDPGPGVFQTGGSRRRFRRRRDAPLLSLGVSRRGATRAGERSCHCLAAGHAPYGLLLAAHSPSCGVLSTRQIVPGTGLPVPAATEVPRLSSIVIGSFTSLGDRIPRSFVVCSELPLRHSFRPHGRFRGAETRSSPLPVHEGVSQFGSVSEPTHRQALAGPLMVELIAVRYLPGTPGWSASRSHASPRTNSPRRPGLNGPAGCEAPSVTNPLWWDCADLLCRQAIAHHPFDTRDLDIVVEACPCRPVSRGLCAIG
jgi:hypothetical protein